MKVAIVCDWLTGFGGAERVVLQLHKMFPDAPIYTSQYDPKKTAWLVNADVRTTWLQVFPKKLKKFLPVLRAWSFSHLDLSDYDLVISSSGAEAKAVKFGPGTVHINYCHAPTHYYWSRYAEYMNSPGFGKLLDPLARLGLKILLGPMKRWDYKAAQRPTVIITNSKYTQSQIKQYYNRDSTVVHPPVDVDRFKPSKTVKRSGFVTAGRQTPYKRIDLAVAACSKNNLSLNVIGDGPDHQRLVKMAGPSVKFLGAIPDDEIPQYFQEAEGFIFPGLDDFGIVAVEALAAGTPVIAYEKGGALDYVNRQTGEFFEHQSVDSLAEKLTNYKSDEFDANEIISIANTYSPDNFRHSISKIIKDELQRRSA